MRVWLRPQAPRAAPGSGPGWPPIKPPPRARQNSPSRSTSVESPQPPPLGPRRTRRRPLGVPGRGRRRGTGGRGRPTAHPDVVAERAVHRRHRLVRLGPTGRPRASRCPHASAYTSESPAASTIARPDAATGHLIRRHSSPPPSALMVTSSTSFRLAAMHLVDELAGVRSRTNVDSGRRRTTFSVEAWTRSPRPLPAR
jgi:hypothetical protein